MTPRKPTPPPEPEPTDTPAMPREAVIKQTGQGLVAVLNGIARAHKEAELAETRKDAA
jgi:hypothetical protein